MSAGYILYNPNAGDGTIHDSADALRVLLNGEVRLLDITRVVNYRVFLGGLEQDDYLILVGGDGTLHRFVNDTEGIDIPQEILYFPQGEINDFARGLGWREDDGPFPIGDYLKELPCAEINGRYVRFLNGVGCGLDGYCCAQRGQQQSGAGTNHRAIAVRGLLFHCSPARAKVTVDGAAHTYCRVWLAQTVYGRYCGGALPVPTRKRDGKTLSVMVLHDVGRLRALAIFSGIFSGKHVKHKKQVEILTGREIAVEFDRPVPLQIDGETMTGVMGYSAGITHRKQIRQGA